MLYETRQYQCKKLYRRSVDKKYANCLMVWSPPEIRDEPAFQSASEPLPPPVPSAKSDGRPECDLDLDVTLEPQETPREEEDEEEAPSLSIGESEDIFSFIFLHNCE